MVRGGGPRPRRQPINERGGLARGPKKVIVAPKRQKTLRIGPKKVETGNAKKPQMRQSQFRLKVRNIDEKQVTNDDLKVSINKNYTVTGVLVITQVKLGRSADSCLRNFSNIWFKTHI